MKKQSLPSESESDIPNIGQPARRALALVGVYHLQDLTKFTEKEVSQLHGVGPKAIGILRRALAEKGLAFADQKSSK
ncbi:MAG TPA: hypothetical protein VJ785_07980 [Anaerolineales bacterium]|nr:hypothetical protein [Anaerolineales bacterium]